MITIESPHNENFRKFLSLTGSKGLKKEKIFLLSGEKLVHEFLQKPSVKIHAEIVTTRLPSLSVTNLCKSEHPVLQLSAELFSQLDVLGTHFNLLVLEQPNLEILEEDDLPGYQPKGIEVVTPIGDPGNLGALIRSCEAFSVPKVILTQEAAHPFLPKSVKASAGSVLRVPMAMGPGLRQFPQTCLALDAQGVSIKDFVWPENALLVLGEEGPGLGERNHSPTFQHYIRIPTQGVESLNVVVAASIALAHKAMYS